MEPIPSAEMLNAAHTFPCPYVFKVVGVNNNDFLARVLAVVEAEIGGVPGHTARATPAGRHLSVTVEHPMASAEQVRAVYGRLQGLDGLVLLL